MTVTSTSQYVGGLVGAIGEGSTIAGCRSDGFVSGAGNVGGFVGYVNSASVTVSDCAARGDVRSTGSYYGGFIGQLCNSSATLDGCWSSGAVWGTGGTIGSFIGYYRSGAVQDCAVSADANGLRPFCGSGSATGETLTAAQVQELSALWPSVKDRASDAKPITTAEELFDVTNHLDGVYALAADIDLDGAAWTPIGNSSTGFTGEFYGQNHKVTGFAVNHAAYDAGFFGRIAGGRVSGLSVSGSVENTSRYTGGFAGEIGSYSLVDGCSFTGTVTGAQQDVGGFVGYLHDNPVVTRCCATDATVTQTGSSASYTGGFAGECSGYVSDCYAIASVTSPYRYVGGFAGSAGNTIAMCYCSATIDASNSYRGAFAGNGGTMTGCYYDSGKTELLAVNNAAKDGVTAVSSDAMKNATSFPAFDFDKTWRIDEGETMPYLRTFLVQLTGFQSFLEEYGLDANTDPLTVTNGIPLIARYVYGIVPMTATTDVNGRPLVDFTVSDGVPTFTLAPQKNADEYGLVFSVKWSRTLSPWQTIDEIRFDADNDGDDSACHPLVNTADDPHMFFKYRLAIKNE